MIGKEAIEAKILEIVHSSANSLCLEDERAFDDPVIGYGAGSDALFDFFRQDIGSFYRLPDEWLADKYGRSFDREDITVISWALPQTRKIRQANEEATDVPARLWSLHRTFGDEFQQRMSGMMEEWFDGAGIPAVSPMVSGNEWQTSDRYGLASKWSERHTAFVCGLGTFGLCDGLITSRGKAVRFCSIIIGEKLEPTPRPYTRRDEYCLKDRGCHACADRCPAGAITLEGGHDKLRCRQYQMSFREKLEKEYGFKGVFGCGLCQTNVPCEYGIPHRD